MKKYTLTALPMVLAPALHAAVTANFVNVDNNTTSASGYTVVTALDGNDLIHSYTRTGNLDGLAGSDDTFSFDIRVEIFQGSTFSGTNVIAGDVTVGSTAQALTLDLSSIHLGGISPALGDDETFVFSIENIDYSRGEGFTETVTFNGFTGIRTFGTAGTDDRSFVIGTTGVTSALYSSGSDLSFAGQETLYLTRLSGPGVTNFRDLDFSFDLDDSTVLIPEPSSTALLGLGSLAVLLRRRRA